MEGYKTDDNRLIAIFKSSRDSWKNKCALKQKKIKFLEIKLRDTASSRAKWKHRTKVIQTQLADKEALLQEQSLLIKAQQAEIQLLKKTSRLKSSAKEQPKTEQSEVVDLTVDCDRDSQELISLKPTHYTYPLFIIQLAIQQRLTNFTSWRGIERNFRLFSQFFSLPTPNFRTIRQWFLKLGLFELHKPKQPRSDWIFILDTTFGHSPKKCFLILGLPYQQWLQKQNSGVSKIQYDDLQVLSLNVLESTKGSILASILDDLTSIVGQPLQIISDHGTDLIRGIKLHQQQHPEIISTYDFTHQVALWFKAKANHDPRFTNFLAICSSIRSQINSTNLSFLMAPGAKSLARYHNVDIFIHWAAKIFRYWDRQDFSLIDEISSFGKKKFLSYFRPLLHYRLELNTYREVLSVYRCAKQLLTRNGLHQQSVSDWLNISQKFADSPQIQSSIQQVTQYLITESQHLTQGLVLPSRSDIIESLFSKYKQFRNSSPFSEINEMILSFCLFTSKLTTENILTALENVTVNDLNSWIKSTFGQSFLSKRKQAFSTT